MNLEDFIETSLRQIIEGTRKAQAATRIPGKERSEADLVNPAIMYSADSAPKGMHYATQNRNLVHFVEFDVAVTTDSSLEGKGNAGIKIAGIGVGFGTSASATDRDTVVSRIKFSVPLTLPQTDS